MQLPHRGRLRLGGLGGDHRAAARRGRHRGRGGQTARTPPCPRPRARRTVYRAWSHASRGPRHPLARLLKRPSPRGRGPPDLGAALSPDLVRRVGHAFRGGSRLKAVKGRASEASSPGERPKAQPVVVFFRAWPALTRKEAPMLSHQSQDALARDRDSTGDPQPRPDFPFDGAAVHRTPALSASHFPQPKYTGEVGADRHERCGVRNCRLQSARAPRPHRDRIPGQPARG